MLLDYNLTLFQDDEVFKLNLDSILLAEYVTLKKNTKVLDLCSGNAIVPLILLTKEKKLKIDCVEIQKNACELAMKNIKANNFESRINVINDNLNNIKRRNYYDIITCNPPYYKENNNKSLNLSRRISKYEIYTNIEEIVKYSKKYLSPKGKLFIVFKPERIAELIFLLKKYNFGVLNITNIITKSKKVNLVLVESQKSRKDNTRINILDVQKLNSYKNIFNK